MTSDTVRVGRPRIVETTFNRARPFGQDRKIFSLHRPEAQAVDLFQQSRPARSAAQ